MEKKMWMKKILSMLCIVGVGFVLFNVAFMLAALIMGGLARLGGNYGIPPSYSRIIFLVVILAISWLILRSKLNDLIKATYFTMPLMVVLVMIGIFSYQLSEFVVYILGGVVIGAVTFYLYKKKLSWLYYFATGYVALLALIVMLTGIDI